MLLLVFFFFFQLRYAVKLNTCLVFCKIFNDKFSDPTISLVPEQYINITLGVSLFRMKLWRLCQVSSFKFIKSSKRISYNEHRLQIARRLLKTHKHKLLVEGVKKVEFEYINYLLREEKKSDEKWRKTSV